MRLGRKLAEGVAVDREAEQAVRAEQRVPTKRTSVPAEVTALAEPPEPVRPARV
ncbi:MAG: hypothetical protein OJJ54_12705 [Pseudonocardia sp.]|nr:hypothetical protein [Pseudonocardia sp.]